MRDDLDQHDMPEGEPAASPDGEPGSLFGDVGALIEDGRTYAEAELAFQKSRMVYVADRAKWVLMLGALGALLVVLAVIALVIGALFALTPTLGAWGAAGAVFGGLLLSAYCLIQLAKARLKRLMRAFVSEAE